MPTGTMADRYRGFRYLVEIEGIPRGAFGYCAGLAAAHHPVGYFISDDEIDLVDVAEVDHPTRVTLAQGVAFDDSIYHWQRGSTEGHPEVHEGNILELDGRGHVRHTYHFSGARPSFYQGVLAAGSGADRHIDTLELTYDVLTLD